VWYSSNGHSKDVYFNIDHDRVPVQVIDEIWPNLQVSFREALDGGVVTAQSLSDYTAQLLTSRSPFDLGGNGAPKQGYVQVPAGAPGASHSDMLDWHQYAVYSRRQVCYIAALVAAGNQASNYDSGLSRLIPPTKCDSDLYQAGFKRALLGLLAACSVDPTLKDGAQGPVLVVAKSTDDLTKAPSLLDSDVPLSAAPLRTCRFRDGSDGNPPISDSISATPEAACQPTSSTPVDFMRAGNSMKGQVIVDITAAWIGGYILAHKGCGSIDGGQDERLMTTMPEVMILSFFLSEKASPLASEGRSLLVPAYILGARRIFGGLDGTSRDIGPENFNQGKPDVNLDVPLTSDLVDIEVGGMKTNIGKTSPFLGFQSINQEAGLAQDVPPARKNQNPIQFETTGEYGFEAQVKAWYNAVALDAWHPDVQAVLKKTVQAIGSGPWGSGVWWGNSQIFALVAWIGQALAQSSWGRDMPLDYYIYSSFTENPSNQCLVHSKAACSACLAACDNSGYAGSGNNQRYCCMEPEPWIPSAGLFDGKACLPSELAPTLCGVHGFGEVYDAFRESTVGELWDKVKTAADALHDNPEEATLFDKMLATH